MLGRADIIGECRLNLMLPVFGRQLWRQNRLRFGILEPKRFSTLSDLRELIGYRGKTVGHLASECLQSLAKGANALHSSGHRGA
jgi:hypothetical protein